VPARTAVPSVLRSRKRKRSRSRSRPFYSHSIVAGGFEL